MQTSSFDDGTYMMATSIRSAERREGTHNDAGPSRTPVASFPHCSFCLVAEFDIDKGSTLSYQYPAPTGHDEHKLAELMLPDGVHARAEDWTVFFLSDKSKSTADQRQEDSAAVPKDLIHVLNLVHTKHDDSVRRGALVKAIAIGTRHPFIQIFKPALLLALDEFFENPGMDVLARLFDSINALDLCEMPRLTRNEKLVLRGSERRDLLEERFVTSFKASSNPRPLQAMEASELLSEDMTVHAARASDAAQQHLRSDSSSSGPSADDPNNRPTARSISGKRPALNNKPSLASLRLTAGAGLLKRKPSSVAPNSDHNQVDNQASPTSANNSNNMPSAVVRDTHVWETSISYGKIRELPIRVPTDVFDEEVGEYSLIKLINTFGASSITGPQHPHLHTNGSLTSPIILLFNAVVTGKRVIFLGHNLPANQVAGHVLSLCALATGCGSKLSGVVARCFPYANLASIDDLESVAGYVAGVTNPRFEDLKIWDVLCNIETGRITVSKDIEPAPPLRPTGGPSFVNTFASSGDGTYANGIGPDGEARLARAPSETDVVGTMTGSQVNIGKGRDRSGTSSIEARTDAYDNAFMDEVLIAVAARYSEKYVRCRFAEYASYFVRSAARHEEYFYGQTSLAPSSQPFLNGQLGSGMIFVDREIETKEIMMNAKRIEAWRMTDSYAILMANVDNTGVIRSLFDFDLGHQISRLRRAKKVSNGEAEMIFVMLAKQLRTPDHVVELLASLPAHHGGLLPISTGLFHSSNGIRAAAMEILAVVASHPLGRKLVQGLNVFHRLALARGLYEDPEADQQPQSIPLGDRGYTPSPNPDKSHNLYAPLAGTPLSSTPMSLAGSQASGGLYPAAHSTGAPHQPSNTDANVATMPVA